MLLEKIDPKEAAHALSVDAALGPLICSSRQLVKHLGVVVVMVSTMVMNRGQASVTVADTVTAIV